MSAPAVEVELWSDFSWVSGAVAIGALIVLGGTFSESLDNSDALSMTIQSDARVPITLRTVARVTAASGAVMQYRVSSIGATLVDDQRTIRALSPYADLGTLGLVYTTIDGVVRYDVGGRYTAAEFLSDVILTNLADMGASHLAVGTVASTGYETIEAPVEGWTISEWCRNVADRFGLELRVRPNGDIEQLIDLVAMVGASAADVPVAMGKNLLAIQNDQDDGELCTAITPLGSIEDGASTPASIAENAWELGTIPGGAPYWIPVTDPAGGAGPIAFASQFGTAAGSQSAYLLRSDAGTTEIVDSRTTPDNAVLVAATTGLTAGHHVQFVADTSATRLKELRAPNVSRLHRSDRLATTRGERNLLRNALMLDWTDMFTPALWTAQGGTLLIGEYPRDESVTFSGIVTNGLQLAGAGGINFRSAPALARFYTGETLVVGGNLYRVGNNVAIADGAGVGSIVFLSGTLPANVADGSTITWLGQTPKRPLEFPTERDTNNVMRLLSAGSGTVPPSATSLRMQSESFRIKYVAGALAQVNVSAAFTMHNGGGSDYGNLDGGGALTEDAALVVTRNLPAVMLRDNAAASRLAWGMITQRVHAGATLHDLATCSTTLSADTTIDVCLLPAREPNTLWNGCRYVTVWLGPTTNVPPYPGSWGNLLWQRGNRVLVGRSLASRQIRCTLRDLSAAAGFSVSREQLTLGGTTTLEDLGVTVRIIALTYSLIDPGNVELLLDARPTRLTKFLAERV